MQNVIETPKYRAFTTGRLNEFWPTSLHASDSFKELFTGMYLEDPSKRASLNQIASHPWLEGEEPSPEELKTEITRLQEIQAGNLLEWT